MIPAVAVTDAVVAVVVNTGVAALISLSQSLLLMLSWLSTSVRLHINSFIYGV